MSETTTGTYLTAERPTLCGHCREYTIQPGELYIVDVDGLLCGYDCGCGDPAYGDGVAPS